MIDSASLARAVQRCFQLAMDTRVPRRERKQFLIQGKQLRGHLLNLISARFEAETPEVTAANRSLGRVNRKLASVTEDLESAADAIEGLTALTRELEGLFKIVDRFI